jgi:putative two-component system response regulator
MTLDITMPKRSGMELLREVRQCHPDLEVVMLTGLGETRTAIDALTLGASAYLIKPVERTELLFHVQRGLERRRLILENRDYTARLEQRVRDQTLAICHAHEETVYRLARATMCRDEETGAHIRRVGLFSELLARALGWTSVYVEHIRIAAPMHDIGKIGIPDAILRKPGKLTADEYKLMKQHTIIGAEILAGSHSPVLKLAREITLAHHEWWDGRGYPAGLRGDAIPESARIVAIADVYDALTHDRVYRPALPEEEALMIMERGAGTQFDPLLFDLFLSVVPQMRLISAENPDESMEPLPQRARPISGSSVPEALYPELLQ